MTKYQHYKGGIYNLLSTSVYHTETSERLAVYENAEGKVFARPYDMFFEKVEVDGVTVERFKEIKEKEITPTASMRQKPKPLTESQRKFRDMLDNPPKKNYMNNLLKKYGRNG